MKTNRSIAIIIWLVVSIFYAYQYIIRVMPNIMLEDIMTRFNIDAAIFGQFSGIYYIGYSLMHLPIGIMLDKYEPKKIMSACILLTVVGMLPIIFSTNWILAVIGRLMIGIGSSAAILGTFKIIRLTFKKEHFTRMLSMSVTIGLIGAIYGGAPVSYLCQTQGYENVVKIFAVMGVGLSVVTYFLVPDIEEDKEESVLANIRLVLSNKKVILLCLLSGLMVGPLEGFADVWGTEFFKKVYKYNEMEASSLPSMIFVGMCFGAPVLSFIAEKTGNYLGAIIGAGTCMFVTFFLLIMNVMSSTTISASFLLVGLCCAYQIIAIYKASTYVPEKAAGLTTAIANMIIMIFGYCFHSAIGYVIDLYGGADNAEAFKYGISIIPICLSLAVVGFSLIAITEKNRG